MEIANGLKLVDKRLKPFILQVSSEPDWFKDTENCGSNASSGDTPQVPDEADFRPLGAITDLLTVNTILELPNQVKRLNDNIPSVAQIYICPQQRESFLLSEFWKYTERDEAATQQKRTLNIRKKARQQAQYKTVALSWWLSPPLQAFLDGQIYSKHNLAERSCVISLLEDGLSGKLCR